MIHSFATETELFDIPRPPVRTALAFKGQAPFGDFVRLSPNGIARMKSGVRAEPFNGSGTAAGLFTNL